MYEIFAKLLNMSLTAGILVLIVIILRLALKKAPQNYVCILWAMVALRLILPFAISSPLSAYNIFSHNTDSSGQVEYFEYNGKTEKPKLVFEVPALVNDNYSTDSMTVGTKTTGVYMPAVVCIWLLGVTAMSVYAVASFSHLRKTVKISIKKDDNIFFCDEINSPFILGIIRPKIYLPSGMSNEVKENVVAHEQAHIKRLDYIWKPFGYVLLSIYWFNPLIWLAYILLCKDIEAACDEKVISQMDKNHVAGYSQALLVCASQRRMITACPVAFGETDVKGRVKKVLNYKKPALWIVCISVIACIIVAICFLTNPQGKKNNLGVTIGLYTNNDIKGDPMFYTSGILINEDGTFSFSPSVISSYMGVGTWEKDGEYIVFNDRGMGDVRKQVFRYNDGKLYYNAGESAINSMWGLSDNTEFVYRDYTTLLEWALNNRNAKKYDETTETNFTPNESGTDFEAGNMGVAGTDSNTESTYLYDVTLASPAITKIVFYDCNKNEVSDDAYWYDASLIDEIMIQWEGGCPDSIKMFAVPAGSNTIEETKLLLTKEVTDGDNVELIGADLLRQEYMSHIYFQLDFQKTIILSDIYNVLCENE